MIALGSPHQSSAVGSGPCLPCRPESLGATLAQGHLPRDLGLEANHSCPVGQCPVILRERNQAWSPDLGSALPHSPRQLKKKPSTYNVPLTCKVHRTGFFQSGLVWGTMLHILVPRHQQGTRCTNLQMRGTHWRPFRGGYSHSGSTSPLLVFYQISRKRRDGWCLPALPSSHACPSHATHFDLSLSFGLASQRQHCSLRILQRSSSFE